MAREAGAWMHMGWYRWCVTYLHSCQLLHDNGERAWPWHVRFVWPEAGRQIEQQFPRRK